MNTQLPPTTLSEERLRELKELWRQVQRNKEKGFPPNADTYEFERLCVQNGASLVHAAEQMAKVRDENDRLKFSLKAADRAHELLEEQLDDIRESLPDDSPSHRADITGQTMAEDVADLVRANDGFQKLCDEPRLNLSQWREISTAPKDGSYILLL